MATCGGPARIERRAIELHDSKVLWWRAEGVDLRIRLDAYVHISSGEPGFDAGTGWSQEVEVVVREASVAAVPAETFLWITEGSVDFEGSAQCSLRLPFEGRGPVRLQWTGAEGRLIVSGCGLSVIPLGEPVFVERFAGSGESS
jgi:hypothetical protein